VSDLLSRLAALGPAERATLMGRLRPARSQPATGDLDAVGPVPASPTQTRLWLHQRIEPSSPLYNLAAGLRLEGRLDLRALEHTLSEIVRRHEPLRTAFPPVQGLPVQAVAAPAPVDLPLLDLRSTPPAERRERLRHVCRIEGRRPFDLGRAPLARFTLVRLGTEDHLLLVVVHHLVADGRSFELFAREFGVLYQAFAEGRQSPLPELPVPYREAALLQQERLSGEAFANQMAYWRDLLTAQPPVLHLPTDRPRPSVQTTNGRLRRFDLPAALSAAMKERASQARHTAFSGLLAAFAVLLHRLSGQDQVVIGTPVSGRTTVATEGLIGFFVNTLPLRLDLSGAPSHAEAARRVHRHVVAALGHQDVPFDQLVQALRLNRDPSRPVLRQVAFAFQTMPPPVMRVGRLTVKTVSPMDIDLGVARLDLSLHMWEEGGRLRGVFEYNTDLFEDSTVAGWANDFRDVLRQSLEAPDHPVRRGPLPAAPEGDAEPAESNLTQNQQLFWFGKKYQPDVRLYFEHITALFDIRADVQLDHFQRAFAKLVDYSDSLRSVFREDNGVPRRLVLQSMPVEVEQVDLSGVPDPSAAARAWAAERSRPDLDLGNRLFDSALLKLGPEHFAWYLNVHHLVSDAWSTALILRYVSQYYLLSRDGRLDQAIAPHAYQDYLAHERELHGSARYRRAERYWREKLAQTPNRIGFYEREGTKPTTRIARISRDLGPDRTRRIRELTRREGFMSPAVILGAALFAYLYRVSGERLLRVGTPFANRPGAFRDTIGLFMNACPLQVEMEGRLDFRGLARQVQFELVEAGRHQEYPVRHPAEGRLYDVYLNFQNATFLGFGGPVEVKLIGTAHSNDRLTLQVHDFAAADRFTVDFDFNVHSFGTDDRQRSVTHYVNLLDSLLDEPGQQVCAARMLSAAEEAHLTSVGRTARPHPLDVPLHEWVERQAARTPDAPAAGSEGRQWTYQELNDLANAKARLLRKIGIGADSVVGVCMERSLEMVLGLLSVLKAGGAYLPLDPSLPADRLAFMARDAAVEVVLTQSWLLPRLPPLAKRTICLDHEDPGGARQDNLGVPVAPEHLAYVMYTSGSTGQPKGVMIPHQGICNRLLWMQETYRLDATDRVLQKTPFGFDVSVWEFFWPLMTGAGLVLARPDGHRDPAYLASLIRREQITTLHFVPSMLRAFADAPAVDGCTSIRRIFCSGEALSPDLAKRILSRLRWAELHNLYGPTEASVDVTHWTCRPEDRPAEVPIGRPIANTDLYVLDRHLNPVPAGIPGELHIGGVGLARGYLNRPALTAERFIPHPFSSAPEARLYRTGDLVRLRPDGNLLFLGRLDDQVKLRGFRIELGEIETELARHPALSGAAVSVWKDADGEARLVAYPVAREAQAPAVPDLRDFLAARLPEYMLPSAFVPLPALPVTPSGKLDRRALPPPTPAQGPRGALVASRTPVEESIAAVWAEELHLQQVGAHEDFFELGGHSLLAARIVARLSQLFGTELPLATFFRARTVAALAELVSGPGPAHSANALLVPIQPAGHLPPVFALHPAGGEVMVYRELSSVLGGQQPLIGLQSRAVGAADEEHDGIERMAASYARAIRGYQPDGPYFLLGWSMGGVLAVSVAGALEAQGQPVAFVGLLDAHLSDDAQGRDPLLAPAVALADALSNAWDRLDAEDVDELRERLHELTLDERLREVTIWLRRQRLLAAELPLAVLRRRAELATVHEKLLTGHRPPTVQTPMSVWWADQDLSRRPHRTTDWNRYTRGGAHEETVPGNHFTLLRLPRCAVLGRRLGRVLEEARSRHLPHDSEIAGGW
jgi:amino acid adenylation domain-containing protein